MLQEFFVDNYKLLINVTFCPAKVNLLIGANNSGKTTLCQAMQFLSASTYLKLDECADRISRGRHSIKNFYLQKPVVDFCIKATVPYTGGEEYLFQYKIRIAVDKRVEAFPQVALEMESLHVTGGSFHDTLLLENNRGKARLLHEPFFFTGKVFYLDVNLPSDMTILHNVVDNKVHEMSILFKQYLTAWQYYSLSPDAMRCFAHRPNQIVLESNGGNLASVLYRLKNQDERSYRRLLEHLRKIDPRIDLINFIQAGGDKVLMYFEDASRNNLPSDSASEGTLCFLALIYVLIYQRKFPPPLLMIEEPENGIYVGLLQHLMNLLGEDESSPQVIFTSHSPYFIDLFDNRLEGLFVLKRGEQNSRLEQPDANEVKTRLETYPLGEQHFREMFQ